jgi:outer membrane protein assembly factor BamE
MMPQKTFFVVLSFCLLLSACSSLDFPWVYRIDIPQGNFVTSDMVAKLQPGMTPSQVRFVMGPPMLVDPFTPDTWFYLMTYRPSHGKTVDQNLVVYFKDGHYTHYSGQVIKDFQQKTQGRKDTELMEKARIQGSEAQQPDQGTSE